MPFSEQRNIAASIFKKMLSYRRETAL